MRACRLLLAFACCAFGAEKPTAPSPALTPAEVIDAQLWALQHADEPQPDAGIRTAFRFASPANQQSTGPVERFIEMLRGEAYAPMLNYRSDVRSDVTVVGDAARQKVTLIAADGKQVNYVFILSRQSAPPCEGCWMTDAVFQVERPVDGVRIASQPAWGFEYATLARPR